MDSVSATDWLTESLPDTPSWHIDETVKLAEILATRGIDLLDVSSGNNHPKQRVKGGPGYQVPFAEAVKKAIGDKMLVASVGVINEGPLAESILQEGKADAVFVARHFQKRPGLVWDWAEELGVEIKVANQIEWGFAGRGRGGARKIYIDKDGQGHEGSKDAKL